MKRLTAVLLIAGLMTPGVALGGACCHASASEAPGWVHASCGCPEEIGCGLSAESCESSVLQERQAISPRLSDGSCTLRGHGALSSFSPLTIRSWWARKVRVASTDPPESFHPVVSLSLRL